MRFAPILLMLTLLPLTVGAARAQAVDSALGYFPLAVGNTWQYAFVWNNLGTVGTGEVTVSVVDTVTMSDGHRYFKVTSTDSWPFDKLWAPVEYTRLDSATGVVYRIIPPDTAVIIRGRLRCVDAADSEIQRSHLRWIGCWPTTADSVLGVAAPTKRNGDLVDEIFRAVDTYAFGFGLAAHVRPSPDGRMYEHLVYARIDGREYGHLQGVSDRHDADAVTMLVSPNPASIDAVLEVTVPRSCMGSVALTDALGVMVGEPIALVLHEGRNAVPLDVRLLPCGAYWCGVRAGEFRMARPVMVVR